MKKITILNMTRLRTEESFGYLKQILAETSNLPLETESPGGLSILAATNTVLQAKVDEFTTAYNAFDTALKTSAVNPATATATATDEARDLSWRGISAYVKAMCAHPTADIAAAAIEAKSLFRQVRRPHEAGTDRRKRRFA